MLVSNFADVEFASERAMELLRCRSEKELLERWHQVRPLYERRCADITASPTRALTLDVDLDAGESPLRLRFEMFSLEEDECTGGLLLIKDRRALESADRNLRLASRMETLVQLYRQAAHDLKAPLNAISLHLELLAETIRMLQKGMLPSSEDPREQIDILRSELMRLDRLLISLLGHARPDVSTPDVFSLQEVARRAVDLAEPLAKKRCVELSFDEGKVSRDGFGYADQLHQAILNLIINALEASGSGGRIDVVAREQGDDVILSIRDQGPGIAPALLERIFDLGVTTKKDGSGIGLGVARAIVEAHGGRLEIQSGLGRGTLVEIRCPTSPSDTDRDL